MDVHIRLFDKFSITVNKRAYELPRPAEEILALFAAAYGNPVSAKAAWEIMRKPLGAKYNAVSFLSASGLLYKSLKEAGIEDMIEKGMEPVRYCFIKPEMLRCDYYDLLDTEDIASMKHRFLPQYGWAQSLFFETTEELDNFWAGKRR